MNMTLLKQILQNPSIFQFFNSDYSKEQTYTGEPFQLVDEKGPFPGIN